MSDVLTIVWKEWKEVFYQRGSLFKGLAFELFVPVIVLGIALPLLAGRDWVGTTGLLLYVWMPPYLAIGIVANAFAGERERHTLETLLASRLPDTAILLGKMLAAVTYGVSVTLLVGMMGVVVVNVVFARGEFLFFSVATLAAMIVTSLLLSSFVAAAGTLVSLRASSVRQAAQRLSFALVLPGLVVAGGYQASPETWKLALFDAAIRVGTVYIAALVLLLFVCADAGLFTLCMARFKRDSLILG